MTNDFYLKVLGTVSPYPYGNSNCPGYLVQNGEQRILLDCGNGVFNKLKLPEDFNNLMIIISHFHGDHYSDIINIIYTYQKYQEKIGSNNKLILLIPEKDESTVNIYNYLTGLDKKHLNIMPYNEKTKFNYGKMNVSFILNPHNIKTYSTKIICNNKILVYSSDTGYEFDHLDVFAEKADLLVCESTYLNDQKGNSSVHLSAFDAGMIAMAADVKMLMLTHFNPEIDKQKYVLEAQKMFENVVAAEEGKKLVLK